MCARATEADFSRDLQLQIGFYVYLCQTLTYHREGVPLGARDGEYWGLRWPAARRGKWG